MSTASDTSSPVPTSTIPQPTETTEIIVEDEMTLVLVNGLLIDGIGSDPVSDAILVIREDLIMDVGPADKVQIPTGATVIDVKGATIMPGFINAHVHVAYDQARLKSWVQGGVTTVRDEGLINQMTLEDGLELRQRTGKDPQYAHLVSAGHMMSVPGGYGSLFVTSPEDARQKVTDQLEMGIDLIKLSLEDGYAGKSGLPKLNAEELEAIIETAHEQGKRVSGHITQSEYLAQMVEAGVDDIAHMPYDPVPEDVFRQMVENDIYVTPTFTVYRNYQASVDVVVENLRRFVELDGKVALGNDYSGGPGQFELGIPMYEIEKMAEAGMTPMQIIIASTSNAAVVCGLGEELGTLQSGKMADILVVDGDPLQDLLVLTRILMVVHSGIVVRNEYP